MTEAATSAQRAVVGAQQRLLDAMPHPAWLVEVQARRVRASNEAARVLFACTPYALQQQPADRLLVSPEDQAWWQACASDVQPLHSTAVVRLLDGRELHVTRSIHPLPLVCGEAQRVLVMLVDGSQVHRAEQEREELLAELQATLEATVDGILVTDLNGRVRVFNQRFLSLWSLPSELMGRGDDARIHARMCRHVAGDEDTQNRYRFELQRLVEGVQLSDVARVELRDGSVLERSTRPLFQGGCVRGRVWSFRDLTEQMVARQQIDALSRQDALTGLPNRRVLAELVQERLELAVGRAGGASGFALLMVDLDRFAQVNDGMGQATGDRVLREVAQRISTCLRQDDLLARLGGDQFAVLVSTQHGEGAEAAARRVLRVVAEPYEVDGKAFTLTCSVGVALAPSHGRSLDELLRHAEDATRCAKRRGRAGYSIYQVRGEEQHEALMAMDHAMRKALLNGSFHLHYQPQVSLADCSVLGAEALLRWRDPVLGEVSPGRFIPVAEASGFIIAIGDWVLSQAVRQGVLWQHAGRPLPIAVNVSALQFQQPHFVERVANVLAVSGLPPHLLELELTESILVLDADEALRRLQALADLGLRLSIDDFGTGYSSLAYLKRFPIDKLKIDRSFVKGLPSDDSDVGIVQAILQMARALKLKVVAEGVETEAQRDFLSSQGCDSFQGFLFAPALDPSSFAQRLQSVSPKLPALPSMAGPSAARLHLVQG